MKDIFLIKYLMTLHLTGQHWKIVIIMKKTLIFSKVLQAIKHWSKNQDITFRGQNSICFIPNIHTHTHTYETWNSANTLGSIPSKSLFCSFWAWVSEFLLSFPVFIGILWHFWSVDMLFRSCLKMNILQGSKSHRLLSHIEEALYLKLYFPVCGACQA